MPGWPARRGVAWLRTYALREYAMSEKCGRGTRTYPGRGRVETAVEGR